MSKKTDAKKDIELLNETIGELENIMQKIVKRGYETKADSMADLDYVHDGILKLIDRINDAKLEIEKNN